MIQSVFIHVLTFALTLVGFSAAAQSNLTKLSLEEAQNYAVTHSSTAKNAYLDLLIQKAKNSEITGLAYPQISAKGEFLGYIDPLKTFRSEERRVGKDSDS